MNQRSIIDRAIGPVYDAIDAGDYKRGGKKCSQILQRWPRDQLVRALKAYCLSQLSPGDSGTGGAAAGLTPSPSPSQSEALRILEDIVEEGPEDDRVLHTMMFVYKAAGSDGLLLAYRSAVEKRPNEPGLRVGLFGAYVRRFDYVRQQQEAVRLAKMDPGHGDLYVWWSICSLVMQYIEGVRASREGGGEARGGDGTRLLQLAYSMAERQEKLTATGGATNGGKVSYEKFLVMTEMLCGLGRHGDAVALGVRFDELCKDRVPGSEKRALLGALYVRAGDFGAASRVYLESAMADPQDWIAWHMYLATMLPELVGRSGVAADSVLGLPLGGRIDGGIVEAWDRVHLEGVWEAAKDAGGVEGGVGERLAAVQEALETLRETCESDGPNASKMRRSLVLAGLEVAKYAFLNECSGGGHGGGHGGGGGQDALCGKIVDAVPSLAVYSSFGTDLRAYIACLDPEHRQRVAVEGMAACKRVAGELIGGRSDGSETNAKDSKAAKAAKDSTSGDAVRGLASGQRPQQECKAFVCVINGYLLQAETGAPLAPASELVSLYFDHVDLVKGYDPKDRGLGEELLVLAVGSLLVESIQGDSLSVSMALQLGLVFIQMAQQARHVSAPLRLAASAIYGLLGADELAVEEFAALDIKGVLHDSLTGHWLIPMLAAACPNEASYAKWFKGIDNLHTVQAQEARDALFTVYEEQTYSKVPEFVDFIQCLDRSNTLYVYRSEAGIARCRDACLSGGEIQRVQAPRDGQDGHDGRVPSDVLAEGILHNDDLTVRPMWYPPSLDGPLFEVQGWWERLYRKQAPWTSGAGLSGTWWARQYAPTVEPSGERAAWERTLDRQLALRLAFPDILRTICRIDTSPGDDSIKASDRARIRAWIITALEAAGMASLPSLHSPTDGLDATACDAIVRAMNDPNTTDIDAISYLRALTVLVGYSLSAATLEQLAKGVQAVHRRCTAALATKRYAGIPFVARISSEEYVWICRMVVDRGGDDDLPGDARDALSAVASAVGDSLESLSSTVCGLDADTVGIRDTIEQGDHALSSCMPYVQQHAYDVGGCLATLADAQAKTLARIQDALARVRSKV